MSWQSCCRWKVAKVSTQKVDFSVEWNIPAVLRDDAIVVWLGWLLFFWSLDFLEKMKCHLISGCWTNMRNKLKVVLRKGDCWVDIHKILLTPWIPLSLRGLCFKDRLFEEGGDEKNATLKQQNALGCQDVSRKHRIKSRLTSWIHLERQFKWLSDLAEHFFLPHEILARFQAADRISCPNGEARQAKKC